MALSRAFMCEATDILVLDRPTAAMNVGVYSHLFELKAAGYR